MNTHRETEIQTDRQAHRQRLRVPSWLIRVSEANGRILHLLPENMSNYFEIFSIV